jgi:HEAT repeat protein
MLLAAALLLAAVGAPDETMGALLRELHADDADVRARASADILEAWPRWNDADLVELDQAALDNDPEIRGRAAEARARIRIRRQIGKNLFDRVARIDVAFLRGDDESKIAAMREAKALWKAGALSKEDFAGLGYIAERAPWTDPYALDRFLGEPDAKQTFSLSGNAQDRARLRVKEVELLGTEGKKRSAQVAEYLTDGAPEVRASALRVIGGAQARDQAPKVAALLRDNYSQVRSEALALLRTWKSKEYGADITRLLEDPNAAIRRRAVEALGACGHKDAGPKVVKFLKDPFPTTRAEAALTLGNLGAREFAPDLIPLLSDSYGTVRRSAAYALGRVGATESVPHLGALLKDRDPEVRLTAAQSLGQVGAELPATEFVALLRDADSEVGSEAAWVLGFSASGSKTVVDGITKLLEDPESEVRQRAVWALGLLKARDARGAVSGRLKDPAAWVRSEALSTLGRIGAKEDAPTLASLLADPDRKVRVHAALALGELGAGDPGGVLAGLERDPDRLLGLSSTLSLLRLGKGNPGTLLAVLRELSTDELAFACLGTVASDVASLVQSREAWAILERPLKLRRAVETWEDLSFVLRDAGLTLDVQTDCTIGRLDQSRVLSGRDALGWLLGRWWAPTLVLDGRKLCLMDRRDSLRYWQDRLAAK